MAQGAVVPLARMLLQAVPSAARDKAATVAAWALSNLVRGAGSPEVPPSSTPYPLPPFHPAPSYPCRHTPAAAATNTAGTTHATVCGPCWLSRIAHARLPSLPSCSAWRGARRASSAC